MRGIQLARYGEKLCVKNINLPLLNNSEKCLVKIHYAPVNPSDAYYVKGLYGMKKALPTIGGFEGCGVIEEANDTDFIGKKVMCWIDDDDSSGTWADYCVVKRKNLIILDEGLPYLNDNFASYCSPFINPVTAICFLDIAKKNNS